MKSCLLLQDGFGEEEITDLSLESAGITSIIWAIGYSFDFSLVKLPVCDADGFPLQNRGVTRYPGLYFTGAAVAAQVPVRAPVGHG